MSRLIPHSTIRRFVLTVWHLLLRTFAPRRTNDLPLDPKRILLVNGAHLGDVVIATSLIPILKSAFPDAQIGFLTASWSDAVVQNHPGVSFTHCADHWRMNRGNASFWQKKLQYWKTRQQALREIREIGYDLSVSMHPWRADFLPLTWQAAIPKRVAFSDSLFAPLATDLAQYPEHERFIHQGECQARLLWALGIDEKHFKLRRSSLAPSSRKAVAEVCHLLGVQQMSEVTYSVIHMGAGSPIRELPTAFWRDVAGRLSANHYVLFTGKGPREWRNAAIASAGVPKCLNVCDHLSWEGFVAAIRHAHTFYGVDSMASHVAAAVGTECVALYAGMNNLARFRPESGKATVWSNAVPCSACARQSGCAEMTCMQGFDAKQIVQVQVPQVRKVRAS